MKGEVSCVAQGAHGLQFASGPDRSSSLVTGILDLDQPGSRVVRIIGTDTRGHVAHLTLYGFAVEPLSKTTFYFSIAVLVLVDLLQSRYQRKLEAQRTIQQNAVASSEA